MQPATEVYGTIAFTQETAAALVRNFDDLASNGVVSCDLAAEFTQDMAETLDSYFNIYAKDGLVTIEVTNRGLWLPNPFGGRQFLGLARLPGKD